MVQAGDRSTTPAAHNKAEEEEGDGEEDSSEEESSENSDSSEPFSELSSSRAVSPTHEDT